MKNRIRFGVAISAVLVAIALLFIPLPQQSGLDTRIVTVASIQRPAAVVFDFVTTPAHWPAWHPSSLAVSGAVDHPLDLGEQVTEQFIVAGRRGHVVWTVVAREPPHKWAIDGNIDGRPAGTVTYSLTSTAGGTRFEREFKYGAPSLWFAILNRLILRARVQSESDTAVLRLKSLLEATPQH
jgi:uncharacterized protein YndB with AHSA1/START domain